MKKIDHVTNPPTRESMCRDFGADPARLSRAVESIHACAVEEEDLDKEGVKEILSAGEVARVLMQCGLVDGYALLCLLMGGKGGKLGILSEWGTGCHTVGGLLDITASFDDSGALLAMEGKFDTGEPFGLGIRGELRAQGVILGAWKRVRETGGTMILSSRTLEFPPPNFCESARMGLREYEIIRARSGVESWMVPITVIRNCSPPSSAYRKFLEERWYDPGMSPEERIKEPVERQIYDDFIHECRTASDRFEEAMAALEEIRLD